MTNQDNRHHCYLSTILSALTDVPGRCHLGKSRLFSNFATTAQILLSRMSMYLTELIFPSTFVIVPTPSLHIHPQNITDTRTQPLRLPCNPEHCVCVADFRHTYTRELFPNTTYISSDNIILFHFSCIVKCSLFRLHRTRFFLFFNEIVSVFAAILL